MCVGSGEAPINSSIAGHIQTSTHFWGRGALILALQHKFLDGEIPTVFRVTGFIAIALPQVFLL